MNSKLALLTRVAFFVLLFFCLLHLVQSTSNEVNNDDSKDAASAKSKSSGGAKKLQIGIKKRPEKCDRKSRKGDVLHMHYRGTLEDGTEFDSSYNRGDPLTFTLGSGQVIRGWDQGLLGMCEGEKRKLVIPSELGYGSAGAPPTIPGDATLVFEVELVKIERKSEL